MALVGYTNEEEYALEPNDQLEVDAEDKLFATLDPTSRRMRFPKENCLNGHGWFYSKFAQGTRGSWSTFEEN